MWLVGSQLASFGGTLVYATRVLCECRARDNTPGGWGREGMRADLNSLPSLRVWALGPQGRSPRWVLVQPSLPTFCPPALDGHPQGLACAAPSP